MGDARDLVEAGKPFSSPKRLALVLLIYLRGRVGFTDLQKLLGLTPGNLDHHLRSLQDQGIVKMRKRFSWRPIVMVEITPEGAEALRDYVGKLRSLLDEMERSPRAGGGRA
jgi:DNA-binding MarR family transcriptional regulator